MLEILINSGYSREDAMYYIEEHTKVFDDWSSVSEDQIVEGLKLGDTKYYG